ncbi:MAG TPA: hypothetical protein VJ836_04525 [Candidatus Saccharimonadales bacterium]|nr:hypothetical protein [Candidatus Saccharimonadales bacterium]
MSGNHPRLIVLQRQLLHPEPALFQKLQKKIVQKVGTCIPLDQDLVRFARPDNMAASIVGGNAIRYALETTNPTSELSYLNPQLIANRLYAALPASSTREVITRNTTNRTTGTRTDRRDFGIQLEPSDIIAERFAGVTMLRKIGNLPLPNSQAEKLHSMALVLLRTAVYPRALEDELAEIANQYIPPDTPFIFDKVQPVDTTITPIPFAPAACLYLNHAIMKE